MLPGSAAGGLHHVGPNPCPSSRKDRSGASVKKLEWCGSDYALKAINEKEGDAEADKWSAVAMLVLVSWFDSEGGEVTIYREDGIRPSQLLAMRGYNTGTNT